jgi:Tol biopolymer transport system component
MNRTWLQSAELYKTVRLAVGLGVFVTALVFISSPRALGTERILFATDARPNLYRLVAYSAGTSASGMRGLPEASVPFIQHLTSPNGRQKLSVDQTGALWIGPVSGAPTVRLSPAGVNVVAAVPARPAFSPDGRWVAFLGNATHCAPSGCSPTALYVVRSDSKGLRRLAIGVGGDSWSRASRLAYSTASGHLMLVSPNGTGRRVLASDAAAQVPAVSPDGTLVAYLCGRRRAVCVVRPDGRGHRLLGDAEGSPGAVGASQEGVLWSPNSKRIAPLRLGQAGLTVVSLSRGRPDVVTRDQYDWPVAWSSDSSQIAFVRSYAGGPPDDHRICYVRHLYRVAVVGAKRIHLVPADAPQTDAVWVGHRISFTSIRFCSPLQIASANPDGSAVQLLTHSAVDNYAPTPSPDGHMVAFFRDEPIDQSNPNSGIGLWLMDADGQHQQRIDAARATTPPQWSPDSHQLMYVTSDGKAVAILNLADGAIRALGLPPYASYVTGFAWSPDKQTVFVTTGGPDAYLLYSNGTAQELVIPPLGAALLAPTWSPDSSHVAFTGCMVVNPNPPTAWNCALYTSTATGIDLKQLSTPRPGDPHSQLCFENAWSPNGKLIAYNNCENGTQQPTVHAINADGTDDTTVIPSAAPGATDAWSPDSARLAVEVSNSPLPYPPDHNISHIAVVNVATATVSNQIGSDSNNSDPAWSP